MKPNDTRPTEEPPCFSFGLQTSAETFKTAAETRGGCEVITVLLHYNALFIRVLIPGRISPHSPHLYFCVCAIARPAAAIAVLSSGANALLASRSHTGDK
jgi:hypothetical protein